MIFEGIKMSHFTLNPSFKRNLEKSFETWAQHIFETNDDVIKTPRYWDGWVTSNPFRDIVDTEKLRLSGSLTKLSRFKSTMTWATPYVEYVYFGYMLSDGRRIPDRKWVNVAFAENDYKASLVNIFKQNFK
jgi:hypothetical protein